MNSCIVRAAMAILWLVYGAGNANGVAAQPTPVGAAPGFQHRHWTTAHGLPVNQISGWHQSEDGYIWLSTFDGFIRFDGVRFVSVPKALGVELPGPRLASILGEAGGSLWLSGTPSEVIEFRGGELHPHPDLSGQSPPRAVLGGRNNDSERVWLGTDSGLFLREDGRFVRAHDGLITEAVNALFLDPRGVLWIGTEARLLSVSDQGFGVIRTHAWPNGDPVVRLVQDEEGLLWGLGLRTVARIRGDTLERFPDLPSEVLPVQIRRLSPDGEFLLAFRGGTFVLRGDQWTQVRSNRESPIPKHWGFPASDGSKWLVGTDFVAVDGAIVLRGEGFQGIEFDREGTAWIWGVQGLHRLNRGFLEQRGPGHGFPPNTYSISEGANGRLWMTFLEEGQGKLARIQGEEVQIYDPPKDQSFQMAVHEDLRGRVWVGQVTGGVCLLVGFRCDEVTDFGGRRVHGIFESSTGDLWFGTGRGVYRLNPEGVWRHWGVDDGLAHALVRSFAEDRDGRIWFGTFGGGISIWDGTRFETLGVAQGLSSHAIRSLRVDTRGVLWVGTESEGLNRVVETFDARGASQWAIQSYRASDGLFDEGIHEILEDDESRLWMSTNRGLFWVQLEDLNAFALGRIKEIRSTAYNENHGLLNRELNGSVHGSGIRTQSGDLLFAGIGGTVRVDPTRVGLRRAPPVVRIESLRAGEQVWRTDLGGVSLPKGTRTFEVDYTAFDFRNPESIRFRYRLNGLDPDWIEAGARRTAYYTNVPPGRYRLQIAVWREGSEWIESDAVLDVIVPPHVHERRSAQSAALLLIFLTLVGGVNQRERRAARTKNELESLVRARTHVAEEQALRLKEFDEQKNRHFQDLSHELRTPLTLILGSAETLRSSENLGQMHPAAASHLGEVVSNAHRLRSLVDQILDLTRLEAGKMELERRPVDPARFIDNVVLNFAPAAERVRMAIRSRIEVQLPSILIDPDQMWTVLSNLVSNAIKFSTPYTQIEVGLQMAPGRGTADLWLCIYVRDQGIGIPEDELIRVFDRFRRGRRARDEEVPGAGIGLALAKRIIELHGGEIDVVSQVGMGSTFRVFLPFVSAEDGATVPLELNPSAARQRSGVDPCGWSLDDPWSTQRAADIHRPDAWILDSKQPANDTSQTETSATSLPERILIADDHAQVRRLIRGLLEPRFDVQEAGSATEALAAIRARLPRAVICDVRMPGGGAETLLRTLRTDRELQHLPVLLLTASASPEDRVLGFKWGADDYLTKPFEPSELLARIDALFQTQKRQALGLKPAIHLHPGAPTGATDDERFLARLRDVIEENLSDSDFGVEALAKNVGHSRSALYRKLAALGIDSAADLIRKMRLARAKQLLEARTGSVHRIARMCGFPSPAHFSRLFRDEFGVPPSRITEHTGRTKGST